MDASALRASAPLNGALDGAITTVLDQILALSAELEVRLAAALDFPPIYRSDRVAAVQGMVGVAFEHAQSLKILAATRNCTSALGLLRLQYEAILRGFWYLYVASDVTVEKQMNAFSREEVGNNEKIPMQAEMLKSLEAKAPAAAVVSLKGFQSNHWKPLSSFIHSGIHALHRHTKGYPVDLVVEVIKASNGLSTIAANLANLVTSSPFQPGTLAEIRYEFAACLPKLDRGAI